MVQASKATAVAVALFQSRVVSTIVSAMDSAKNLSKPGMP